jgi:hypothetical protein
LEIANEKSDAMNSSRSFFFKSWIWCGLTLVALGTVLVAVQQGLSRWHRPAVLSASPAPVQEVRALPDATAEAGIPQSGIPVAATLKESSPVSAEANVVAPVPPTPVSAPAQETVVLSTGSGQIVVPPLARAVKAASNASSVGSGPSGNNETPTVDPPLAFVVDPKNLTPVQQAAVAQIQDQFLKTVGSANQDPADPAYATRWMNAQYTADQSYKSFFGWPAFEQMQLERAMNSYTAIQMP